MKMRMMMNRMMTKKTKNELKVHSGLLHQKFIQLLAAIDEDELKILSRVFTSVFSIFLLEEVSLKLNLY